MKGILKKTEQGWFVIYDQIFGEGIVKRNQNALPLHPLDVKQIDKDSKVFDNIEARIKSYPDVDFEIVKEYINNHTNELQKYAKLIDKLEPCCTPEGQIKKYVDCIGCDNKPYPVSEDCVEVKNWDSFVEQKNLELLSEEYSKQFDYPEDSSPQLDFINGYNKAKETLYTEEQMELCWIAAMSNRAGFSDSISYKEFIQSLKQVKNK